MKVERLLIGKKPVLYTQCPSFYNRYLVRSAIKDYKIFYSFNMEDGNPVLPDWQ